METDSVRQVLPNWKLIVFHFQLSKRSEFNENLIKQSPFTLVEHETASSQREAYKRFANRRNHAILQIDFSQEVKELVKLSKFPILSLSALITR